jgi:hypothetical protein
MSVRAHLVSMEAPVWNVLISLFTSNLDPNSLISQRHSPTCLPVGKLRLIIHGLYLCITVCVSLLLHYLN